MNNHEEKHNGICDRLDKRLKDKKDSDGNRYYFSIGKTLEYGLNSNTKNCLGEIDNIAIRHGKNNKTYVLLFEDKYKGSLKLCKKARHQLDREEHHLEKIIKSSGMNHYNIKVFKFVVHGYHNGNGYKIRRYK